MASSLNIPLILQTLGYIEEHPETWNQGYWRIPNVDKDTGKASVVESQRCGAQLCFAGHVAALTGARWLVSKKELIELSAQGKLDNMVNSHDFKVALSLVKPPKELKDLDYDPDEKLNWDHPLTKEEVKGYDAGHYAMVVLGLTSEQADELFSAENSAAQLRSYVLSYVFEAMKDDGDWHDSQYTRTLTYA